MKRPFKKEPRTLEEQLARLEQRGLEIPDRQKAMEFLARVQYMRLRPYWHPFEVDPSKHTFRPGTSFNDLVTLYSLDQRLRLLVFEAITHVEVALRSQWAYQLAIAHGPHAYLKTDIHHNQQHHVDNVAHLQEEWRRAWEHDPVLRHFEETYLDEYPPIWLACEVISLGTLSRFFANLKDPVVSHGIASAFGLPHSYLKKVAKHLVVVRNIVAHHGRLWDRKITAFTLMPPRKNPAKLREAMLKTPDQQRIYSTLTVLVYMGEHLGYRGEWYPRLRELLTEFPTSFHLRMGFPRGWEELELWQ
ncbi:MAG: Abi family protein [Thermus sp.]|uniref:Abi family protein n=1 Tax=Thermus sp. TaxID=275 RepID=UPI00391B6751